MNFDGPFAVKVFAALFAIMNPIANIPVFLSLTDGLPDVEKRRIAATAMGGVTIGCVISAMAGRSILHLFGLSINDLRLAGGLLVLLIAIAMLHGAPSSQHHPTEDEQDETPDLENVAIYPLTTPLLVGPGTIATLSVFEHTAVEEDKITAFVAGLAAFLLLLGAALFSAPVIGRYLPPQVASVAKRLMGMILAAIAVNMMIAGLQGYFKILAG